MPKHVETYQKQCPCQEIMLRVENVAKKVMIKCQTRIKNIPENCPNASHIAFCVSIHINKHTLFDTFWKEEWFAGGFIWKWFHDHEQSGGGDNSRFTPQNKPAETVIKTNYASH